MWFRRDLRDYDHAALSEALATARAVYCVFVFDREILDALPDPADRRVEFIYESVGELHRALGKRGGGLIVLSAHAREAIPALAIELEVGHVFCNHDYEPLAIDRDRAVAEALAAAGIAFHTRKDQVIFERDEILTQAHTPFVVFTPYKKAWLAALTPAHIAAYANDDRAGELVRPAGDGTHGLPTLEALGFRRTNLAELAVAAGMSGGAKGFRDFRKRIDAYAESRNYPAAKGPSYLSVHLRFGTVSIRELVAFAHARSLEANGHGAAAWLSELIWREFYAQILWQYPRVATQAFRPEFDRLNFTNDPRMFDAWCEGRTGYPIVDAAMRQLNRTGYMHNRLRMIAASFLVKDLLIDWRWGERYFADKLIDFDLASNNGGWQWSASTGCDAQPYFRIFNPVTQSERFDPDGRFIRNYIPELVALDASEIHTPWKLAPPVQSARGVVIGRDYPPPIVDHATARARALALFAEASARSVTPIARAVR